MKGEVLAADTHTAPVVGSTTCQSEEWEALFAEDSPESLEPNYHKVARVLASVKDDHLDLHAEMSMAISAAKAYGGIGTVCQALGVSEATARKTVGFLGLARISISDVRYEPAEDGPLSIIIPVADSPWSEEPEVHDLLAFLKDVPNRCWSRLGNARCLGRWHLRDAVSWAPWSIQGDNREPVIAFPSPIEWLRGNCSGFCCLHEDWLAYETVGVQAIQPANGDVEFGRELKRLLREQARLPRILVPKKVAA